MSNNVNYRTFLVGLRPEQLILKVKHQRHLGDKRISDRIGGTTHLERLFLAVAYRHFRKRLLKWLFYCQPEIASIGEIRVGVGCCITA